MSEVIEQSKARLQNAITKNKKLGWSLTKSWTIGNLFIEGIEKLELLSPEKDIIVADNECIAVEAIELRMA